MTFTLALALLALVDWDSLVLDGGALLAALAGATIYTLRSRVR